MKINRKSGLAKGKEGNRVYYRWRGRQASRAMPKKQTVPRTKWELDVWTYFGEFSSLWRELPASIQTLWEAYASEQGDAATVEASENVSYPLCPIPNYPPRPRLLDGKSAFVGANMHAKMVGLSIPSIYPPIGVAVPEPPIIECAYDRTKGEVVVETHNLLPNTAAEKADAFKAILWVSAQNNKQGKAYYIVRRQFMDAFDCNGTTEKVVKRYSRIEHTDKTYGYKPLRFSAPEYLRIIIGVQTLYTPEPRIAPIVSSGNWKPFWILNDPRYVGIEDLIKDGEIVHPGRITFGELFYKKVAEKRAKLAE